MSNDNAINLEEFEGLKCSRPNCGGPADIVEEDGDVDVVCSICTNRQTIFTHPEEDSALFDAVHDYLTALDSPDSPRYSASHTQSVEKALTAMRRVFLDASEGD